MKIFLFRPNSEVINALPPLGFLTLAAYLRKFGGHEVRIFDGRLHCSSYAEIGQQIEDFRPDAVGIGLLSIERQVGHQALKYIRKNFPQAVTIMGGPYPTAETLDAMQNPDLDFLVAGEGELVAANLLNFLEKGGDAAAIKGIAYRRNGEVAVNPREELIQDLDDLPANAWDLIHLADYHKGSGRMIHMNVHKKYYESAPILTSRGCPYTCTYCTNYFGRKLRLRSVAGIMSELRLLKQQYGIREIEVVDDAFNLNAKRAKELFRAMIDADMQLHLSFPNGLRADVMDEELVDLMKAAGVYRLVYAIESGSPKIQKEMQKNLDLEKAQKMITYTAKQGISVGTFYMLGFLNETEGDMRQTINFALKSKAHTASFFLLNPFPNTEIYRQAVNSGYQLDDVKFVHYYSLPTNISKVPDETILKFRNQAYRRFFLNPIRIYRFFRTTPSRKYFFRKVLVAVYMFFAQIKEEQKGSAGSTVTEGVHRASFLLKLIYWGSGLNRLEKEMAEEKD